MTTTHPVDSTYCPTCERIGGHAADCPGTPPRLEVERFTTSSSTGTTLHYEADSDLYVHTKGIHHGGRFAGLLMVELGIDGYRTHRAVLELHDDFAGEEDAYSYNRDHLAALNDAIVALTVLRNRLADMTAGGAQ